MIKHIIIWKLRDDMTKEEKQEVKVGIKNGLEGLKGRIPGLKDIRVEINGLPSSNADVMLDATFVDEDALKTYANHPDHLEIANSRVRPFTEIRSCIDYEID